MIEERCQGGCGKVGLPLFGVSFPGVDKVQMCGRCCAEAVRSGRHTEATFNFPEPDDAA